MVPGDNSTAQQRLDSWKEIAAHLGRDVRTVQRWEKSERLPVHRHMHGERGTVYAYPDELDQWWSGRQAPTRRFRRWLWFAVPIAAALVLLLAAIPRLRTAPQPRIARTYGRLLAGTMSEGGRLNLIPLGFPPGEMVVTPDGREAYILHDVEDRLSVLNLRTHEITHTLQVAAHPSSVLVSPDGRRVYVGGGIAQLSIIDTASKKITSIAAGGPAYDLAITPDGRKLYATTEFSGLKRLLTNTLEIAKLPGTVCPMYAAMSPDGRRLYVSYQCGGPAGRAGHDAVDVVDVATETSIATFTGPPLVGGFLGLSPDGAHLWIDARNACFSPQYDHSGCPAVPAGVYHVVRTSDLRLIQSIAFPPFAAVNRAVFFPDASRVIVAGDTVRVIDAARFNTTEMFVLNVPDHRGFLPAVFAPDGQRVYLPLRFRNAIAQFDMSPANCSPPTDGLVGFWPGDGNAEDAQAQRPGVLDKGVSYAPGRIGAAFRFEEGSIRIDHPRTNLANGDGTFAVWIKLGSRMLDTPIASRLAAEKSEGWQVSVDRDGQFSFCLAPDRGCARSKTRAVPNVWYHLAGVRASNNIMLYVNGVREEASVVAAHSEAQVVETVPLYLGGGQGQKSFDGWIDEVVHYGRALTDAEIRQLAAAGSCTGSG